MSEQIIETKNCKSCWQQFHITNKDKEFYDKVSPIFNWNKYQIPNPTLCPECRQQRRLAWRNERKLYRRKCDASGKPLLSFISPDKSYPVYEKNIRFSDKYNPFDYWKDVDLSNSFLWQVKQLLDIVPRYSIQQQEPMENSEYCNCASNCKNCYLLFDSDYNENCYYWNVIKHTKNCIDCSIISNSENCYQSISCEWCYQVFYSKDCIDCSNSFYLKNCINCKDCFGSTNLNNKQYCIFNKQYTKEEYNKNIEALLKKYDIQQIQVFFSKNINKYADIKNSENVSWNNIHNAKNTHSSFDVGDVEDIAYCDFLFRAKSCMDVSSVGENSSNLYESSSVGLDSSNIFFSSSILINSNNIWYSYICYPNVKDCFGCVGMKNAQYCILNKQYTKEEYFQTVQKIIWQMIKDKERWEFFPISMSPFAYNETIAQEYFPFTKEKTQEKGFFWKDEEDKDFQWPSYTPKSIEIYGIIEKSVWLNTLENGII